MTTPFQKSAGRSVSRSRSRLLGQSPSGATTVSEHARNRARGAGVPKDFRKLATSPTRERIERYVADFYGGEKKTLVPIAEKPGWYAVVSGDKTLSTVVIETSRGFYFGVPS